MSISGVHPQGRQQTTLLPAIQVVKNGLKASHAATRSMQGSCVAQPVALSLTGVW
jgi:hypothetical protein